MRPFIRLLVLITVFLVPAGRLAHADDTFRLELFPKVVKQGDVCLIRASGATPLASIHGEFRGKRFPMAIGTPNGTYEGLLGIDLRTRPARYEIKVVATDKGGRVYGNTLGFKVQKVAFRTQTLSLPSSMVDLDPETLARAEREAKRLKALFQAFRDERIWSGAFLRPVPGEVTTSFGLRRIINGQKRQPHAGVDLRAEEGTPVLACNGGVVVLVDQLFFSGRSVVLDHGWGLYSMVAHLSEALVQEGDRVASGAPIGRVGSTGRSTGPHLHWAIRINGAQVNPLSLLQVMNGASR